MITLLASRLSKIGADAPGITLLWDREQSVLLHHTSVHEEGTNLRVSVFSREYRVPLALPGQDRRLRQVCLTGRNRKSTSIIEWKDHVYSTKRRTGPEVQFI